ncbi:MAG: ABC transporter ATP-binding protein, partial [Solobacterium sp.]|nr:ABC transporter ATP-binding protein [Solobacterium sp.]
MIELRNLSVGYGSHPVLENIDLEIHDGRVLVLLGPNGCGKSTLLKTILALQPKLSGEIIVNGTALEHLTNRERARQMAYLPQSRTTPNISVRRMVLHGRFPYMSYPRQYGEDDFRAVEQAMELTGTAEYADAMMPQLSGGQQQKVYIAMALAQGTGTILLDEPTTFLDAGSQLDTYRLAKSFAG